MCTNILYDVEIYGAMSDCEHPVEPILVIIICHFWSNFLIYMNLGTSKHVVFQKYFVEKYVDTDFFLQFTGGTYI